MTTALVVLGAVVLATIVVGALLRRRDGAVRRVSAPGSPSPADAPVVTPALAGAGIGTGTPVVLHFSADWCGPCAAVRRVVARVLDAPDAPAAREVELDLDENAELARDLRVMSLPTTFVFDGGGAQRFRIAGVPEADALRRALSDVA